MNNISKNKFDSLIEHPSTKPGGNLPSAPSINPAPGEKHFEKIGVALRLPKEKYKLLLIFIFI